MADCSLPYPANPLRTLLDYLDRPLQQVPNTAVKARILTLLGYSQRAMGNYSLAQRFHQQALDIAREAKDTPCEIASLNHLSRTCVMQQDFEEATNHSQRALILARQEGDTIGQANALANLGYSQVSQGQSQLMDPDQYEMVLSYLEQGLTLSEQVGDLPSQALCANSLGIAQLKLSQYSESVESLTKGLQVAQAIGDRFLMASKFCPPRRRLPGNRQPGASRSHWLPGDVPALPDRFPRVATTGGGAQHSVRSAGARKLSNHPGRPSAAISRSDWGRWI